MKVIQVPFCYFPDAVGGTEVYVASLAHELQSQGIEVVIAASGNETHSYHYEEILVRRFSLDPVEDVSDIYGAGDEKAAQEFGRIIDEEQPDLVHFHAFTRGASLNMVRELKRRNVSIIFTYHVPGVSCQRSTLLYWGKDICDGILDYKRCSQCVLQSRGLSKTASLAVGNLPPFVGRTVKSLGRSSGWSTALRMTELIQLKHSTFHSFMREVDHVVAVCDWVRDILLRNGVAPEKLTLSRQGISQVVENVVVPTPNPQDKKLPLRVLFLGRLDPIKAPHILIEALKLCPSIDIELHIYGIAQGEEGARYSEQLRALADGDRRIQFFEPIPSHEAVAHLRKYDVLAVPSQCLETGPLVVLEAFAANVPIIGSNIGGIAELVQHELNGLLVQYDSIADWSSNLSRLAVNRKLLKKLRNGIPTPRKMATVADEMIRVYNHIVKVSDDV